jgi:hypothetical protein
MRDKIIVILMTVAASIVVNWWEDYRRIGVSPEGHFWHDVMVSSQKTAETIGRIGIYAENRYREEVREHATGG